MVYVVMQIFAESGTNKIPAGINNNPVCSQKQFSYSSFLVRNTASVNQMQQSSEQREKMNIATLLMLQDPGKKSIPALLCLCFTTIILDVNHMLVINRFSIN